MLKAIKGKGWKLHMHYNGHFGVMEQVSSVAYRLKLPESYMIHPVINIAHLHRYLPSPRELGERPVKHLNKLDFHNLPEYKVQDIIQENLIKSGG